MGLEQLGVLTVGTLVAKGGGHTLLHSTLLVVPPWTRKTPLFVGSPKVITLGHIPCTTWSTRHRIAGWLQT